MNYSIADEAGIYGSYLSPDGSTLAIAHTSSYVKFWDKYNKTLKNTYNFGNWVDRVVYSKNGNYIALSGHKTTVDILNSTTYSLIVTLNSSVGTNAYKADFRFDDEMLIICGSSNQIQIWNVATWTLNKTISVIYSLNYDI